MWKSANIPSCSLIAATIVNLVDGKENRTLDPCPLALAQIFKIMEKHTKFINDKSYGTCDISVDDQTVHSLFNFSSNTKRYMFNLLEKDMFILRIQMGKLRLREQQQMDDVVEERGATLHLNLGVYVLSCSVVSDCLQPLGL